MKHDLTGPPPPPGVEDLRKGTIIGECYVCGARGVGKDSECSGPSKAMLARARSFCGHWQVEDLEDDVADVVAEELAIVENETLRRVRRVLGRLDGGDGGELAFAMRGIQANPARRQLAS